jgi:hypothetical protein
MMAAFLGPLALLIWLPLKNYNLDYSKIFVPSYVALALTWLGILNGFPGTKAYVPDHKPFALTARTGVDWRTEITHANEPNTWPFKEASYMLGCQGINGNYSVYLVKTEDIMFQPDRPKGFIAQYYGLKGSLPGWEKVETQLLSGQAADVIQKYVEKSLELCKRAESAMKDPNARPVKK